MYNVPLVALCLCEIDPASVGANDSNVACAKLAKYAVSEERVEAKDDLVAQTASRLNWDGPCPVQLHPLD